MQGMESLNQESVRRGLLRLARTSAARFLDAKGGEAVHVPAVPGRCGGVFVTYWAGKTLRGCRGTISSTDDLVDAVREVAELSLTDSRFLDKPIRAEELPSLRIEISVLSEPLEESDPAAIVSGKHGILIRQGSRSGCFLPQVASERGWTAEEFLSNCCRMKAGLPADAWKDPKTQVLSFTADVFAEPDPNLDETT
jgi:AmmeMemoRadiSam system protein A